MTVSDTDQTSSQPVDPALASHQFQFRLEEYKSLRGEIDTRIKESFTLVIYCVTAIAAIYGTLVAAALSDKAGATPDPVLRHWVLGAAMIFPVFGLLKSVEAWEITMRIARHIRQFEASLGLTGQPSHDLMGWEHQAEEHRNEEQPPWMVISKPPYILFWLMLIGLTFIIRFAA